MYVDCLRFAMCLVVLCVSCFVVCACVAACVLLLCVCVKYSFVTC